MAKKNVESKLAFKKDENRDAVADVLKSGKVDVSVRVHNKNIEIIWHYNSVDEAIKEMKKMGYKVQD